MSPLRGLEIGDNIERKAVRSFSLITRHTFHIRFTGAACTVMDDRSSTHEGWFLFRSTLQSLADARVLMVDDG